MIIEDICEIKVLLWHFPNLNYNPLFQKEGEMVVNRMFTPILGIPYSMEQISGNGTKMFSKKWSLE